MKKLEAKDFVKINGGCFCYCLTEPFDRSMPTIFVDEVSSKDECRDICYRNESLPYYGGGDCYSALLIPDHFDKLSKSTQDRINYRNGGWKMSKIHYMKGDYSELF